MTRLGSLVLSALAFFAASCVGAQGSPPGPAAAPKPPLGDARAPDFELRTLDGGSARLGAHLGRDVVLIDFWATYCEPCLLALPHLDELYRKYKSRGFVVLGVSIDESALTSRVRIETAKLDLTFPILLDPETRVVALYNPRSSAPYSVLVGRDGRVLKRREGYSSADRDALEREIVAALEP